MRLNDDSKPLTIHSVRRDLVLHGADDGVNSSNDQNADSVRLGDDRIDSSSMAMISKEELTRSAALFMLKTMEVHKTSHVLIIIMTITLF